MAELEKVIAGLEYCIGRNGCWSDHNHEECPWISKCREDSSSLKRDALELLKEKTGKWERHYSRPGVYADLFWWCSCCGEPTRYNDAGIFYQHCPHCGAKLEPCKED